MAVHSPVYSDTKGLGKGHEVKSMENILNLSSRKVSQELACYFTWGIQEEVSNPPELCQNKYKRWVKMILR